ncbi:MAG: Adenylate cyclase [Rhodanobacteraceae bacterium]|jgi:TolB-like protein/DNA-binding winged helix-turn-helix (wHTH) protein/Tfp pilus assembly protein PilF|nr:MAG: Adenylate cyclase [Rhodanobacteraceae bacterium]
MSATDISSSDKDLYVFGSFVLDPLRRLLLRDGVPVQLSPKVFDTLMYLVGHADCLLDKDELLKAVWPGRVVEENNLTHNISILRKVFSSDHSLDRCVVTAPGRGYRFTATLRRMPREMCADEGATIRDGSTVAVWAEENVVRTVEAPLRRRLWFAWSVILLGLAGLLTYLAATRFVPAPAIPASIAVLPFENLSNDRDNAYFAAGIQELILTKLADIGGLKVIARTSTQQYASHPQDLKAIGRQLGVGAVLEGSVQKVGDRALINVQLIDTQTESHVWAHAYIRRLDDVIGVEGEVAQQIAGALQSKLSPAQTASLASVPTRNRAAYDLFLRAEYQANQGDTRYGTAGLKTAIPLYRRAITLDPGFALAWARMSYVESELGWFGGSGEDVGQLHQKAADDAHRAMQLQPDLAAAHLAVGFSEYWGRGDYAAAHKAFAAALQLDPNNAEALAAQGYVERSQGRFDAAISLLQQAFALDPRNSTLAFELATTYMGDNRYADAEAAFQRALALNPDNQYARIYNAYAIEFSTGDVRRALAAVQGDAPILKLARVAFLIDQRNYRDALDLLDGIPDTRDSFVQVGYKLRYQARLYRLMGDEIHARLLYEQVLSKAHAQLDARQGDDLGTWQSIADAELGLGHTAAGVAAIAKAQVLVDNISDHGIGSSQRVGIAELYARAGRPDLSVRQLAEALAAPGVGSYYSPVLLWINPAWDPIRQDASFRALLKQYARYKPAITYATALAGSSLPTAKK